MLDQLISTGEWAIDIGANVGQYTKRLSDLVGQRGRVLAVEPVPETFALLTANAMLFEHRNVTLLSLAASETTGLVGMQIPNFETGLKNYYQATITSLESEFQVMTLALDSLALTHSVGLIKIDAEGHERAVIRGLAQLIARDHPTLIVETSSPDVVTQLADLGYAGERLPGSPNLLFRGSKK